MKFDITKLEWTREPKDFVINPDKIEIITNPHTDLWQRTYYHFRNDNAPVLQMETGEKFFSFTVKTEFESTHRFDQCGIVMYLDSETQNAYNKSMGLNDRVDAPEFPILVPGENAISFDGGIEWVEITPRWWEL